MTLSTTKPMIEDYLAAANGERTLTGLLKVESKRLMLCRPKGASQAPTDTDAQLVEDLTSECRDGRVCGKYAECHATEDAMFGKKVA